MQNIDSYKLGDKAQCKIAPSWGCNLFSWVVDGEELMYCPPDYPDAAFKITGGGNPILFPSVGRTWDHSSGQPVQGTYRIHGHDKTYFMPSHGIIFLCTWRKIEEAQKDDGASVGYELIVPDKVYEENYPFRVGLVQRFTLRSESVDLESVVTNNGTIPAPVAFGYHPYFRISNKEREGVEVHMPVAKHLLLTKDTVLLTGEAEDTDGVVDLQAGIYYDSAYGSPNGTRMSLVDRTAGHAVHVDFDPKSELFFLYSPDDSEFVCIEPWTRGLGAFEHLKDPDWEDGKLIPVLQPGESVSYRATFSVER